MSDITFVKTPLNDIFNVGRGLPKYTQSYANAHKGDYPVYSSKTENNGLFATIDTYDFDGEYLTWSTDGYAGVLFHRVGQFSCTDHCGILSLKENITNVYLPYVQKVLDFRSLAIGNGNTRVKTNMVKRANPLIPFPVNEDGTYNVEEQKAIAQRYEKVEAQKQLLECYKEQLDSTVVSGDFASEYRHTEVQLTDLFVPENGSGDYTKLFCLQNSGAYPVYSGNTVGVFANINKYDYDGDYLTWAKDGLAGNIMYLSGKFSITNHRGILIPTEKCINVDLEYMKYVLEPVFRRHIKGRRGHNGQNEYTTLNSTMIKQIKTKIAIPINEDGTFDLNAQKKIAEKYRKIRQINNSICSKIEELISIKIII